MSDTPIPIPGTRNGHAHQWCSQGCLESDCDFGPCCVIDPPDRARWEPTRHRWYAVVDDLIGGWAVSHVDKSLSQQDFRKGEGLIAGFCWEAVARHIADLHNAWGLRSGIIGRLQPRNVWVRSDDLQLVLDILIENGMVESEDEAAVQRLHEALHEGS